MLLLPDTVDGYVGPDNPVRFIGAFVDSLDWAGAGFERAEPKETGRPGYDPSGLLKLSIYGYLNRVRSSRRLEAETHRNLEVIWLLRRLRPNFKTIADFRRENRESFRDFVKVCQRLELFGRELIAVDGTRIKAVNNRDRNFTEVQLSLTDPNARAMHSGTGVGVGYSVQIAVATKHKLIAEQPVHSQISDLGLLAETARAARTSLGVERIEAVAGKGYFKGEDIAGCEAAGHTTTSRAEVLQAWGDYLTQP